MHTTPDIQLLQEIYQNARIGMEAIDIIQVKTKNLELIGALSAQRSEYMDIAKKAAEQLLSHDVLPPENSTFSKSMLWTSIQVSTIFDSSTRHLAQLLINGSRMGLEEIQCLMARNLPTGEEATRLGDRLIAHEKKSIEQFKAYAAQSEDEDQDANAQEPASKDQATTANPDIESKPDMPKENAVQNPDKSDQDCDQ